MSLTHLHGSHCEEFTNSDQPSMAMRGENSRAEACFYYTNLPFSRKSLNKVQQCLLTLISNGTKLPQYYSSIVTHLHVAFFFIINFSTNAHLRFWLGSSWQKFIRSWQHQQLRSVSRVDVQLTYGALLLHLVNSHFEKKKKIKATI